MTSTLYRFKIFVVPLSLAPPGSTEAGRRGCDCPSRENRGGKGLDVAVDGMRRGFWIGDDCPLHKDILQAAKSGEHS